MILRMVLLPSDAERVISQEPKLYSYFFSSNAPHVLLRLLCSAKVSENAEIRHIETRNSLIAGLTEICRFITLVIVKRDEIEILTKRQKAPRHQNTLTVLGSIQNLFQFTLRQQKGANRVHIFDKILNHCKLRWTILFFIWPSRKRSK